jgi:hypothetical protein
MKTTATTPHAEGDQAETPLERSLDEVFSDSAAGEGSTDLDTYWLCVGFEEW